VTGGVVNDCTAGCDEGFNDLLGLVEHETSHALASGVWHMRPSAAPYKVAPSADSLPATPRAVPVYGDQGLVIYAQRVPPEMREHIDQWVCTSCAF
jgi:hypothetical protein